MSELKLVLDEHTKNPLVSIMHVDRSRCLHIARPTTSPHYPSHSFGFRHQHSITARYSVLQREHHAVFLFLCCWVFDLKVCLFENSFLLMNNHVDLQPLRKGLNWGFGYGLLGFPSFFSSHSNSIVTGTVFSLLRAKISHCESTRSCTMFFCLFRNTKTTSDSYFWSSTRLRNGCFLVLVGNPKYARQVFIVRWMFTKTGAVFFPRTSHTRAHRFTLTPTHIHTASHSHRLTFTVT
jgi:hypothetical protein